MYAKAETAPIIYCLGVTEHTTGTQGVMSMANLAMLVGKLGKPGCGVNPLRGQNNVQGACDMGATPGDFPGYQKLANKEVFEKFEKAWNCKLPTAPGIRATECFPEMIAGNIKGLFIFGEDPVRTDADTSHVIKALESLEFLVVDDLFLTESAKYADVVLPGSAYAEKEGTFSNTERRVQRIRKAVNAPGEARLDTDIFIDIMNRMGYPQPHLTSAEIMDEIASLTPSFAGISHARLDSEEVAGQGLQWPCTAPDHPGTPIMHVGKFTRGLGKLQGIEYIPSAELTDDEYPLILMTGRILYHYNACAMTDKTPGLNELAGHSFIEINTADAAELGISDGDRVKVSSRRGEIESEARVSDKTHPGETWMPFHFQDGNANWLTNAALDTIAAAPEYKVCAIKVRRA
jgi:formate dehydrogenase major subunit